jgi:predicted carbohydrate-binding protein with CBM5 and CBM33 domain
MTMTMTGLVQVGFLLFSALTPQLPTAMGHGFLSVPRSRNAKANSAYCPHCLNGGGSGATATGLHGMCGTWTSTDER